MPPKTDPNGEPTPIEQLPKPKKASTETSDENSNEVVNADQ
jgi:hypothetical protein